MTGEIDRVALLAAGTELLAREGLYLDEQRWDEWLALYCEDCEFWAPAWKNNTEMTADFNREISIFYFKSRAGLEDRVWRIRSGEAPSLNPVPRTTHVVSNALLSDDAADDAMTLHSAWTCHVYFLRNKTQHVFFGRQSHALVRSEAGWRIQRKKVVLMNDYVPAMIDVFCV
jgi:3-phenylpropionate/cinnamic acid dioxygenase small subunit